MSHRRALTTARRMTVVLGLAFAPLLPSVPAQAQAIAVVVNGDPVTSIDIEQRMKLLKALHRPATRDAAVESMINDRLKAKEAGRFGVNIPDADIGEAISAVAVKYKTTATTMMNEIQHAGVQKDHFMAFFKAEYGYDILVKALNKGVEASETAVRSEMAKGSERSSFTQYTLQQVVLTLGPGAGADIQGTVKEAEALRGKFSSCSTGIPYAKTLSGVAVREPLTRTSTQLSAPLKELLDKTPLGHLTAPSRTSSGLEMIAVCARGAPKDDTELRKAVSDRILQAHIDEDAAKRLKEMRAHAVIEKR
jgi:peptidyl-prolyl cis-trans isomerase SurA